MTALTYMELLGYVFKPKELHVDASTLSNTVPFGSMHKSVDSQVFLLLT